MSKDRIFNYKYYALHRCSTMCLGILDECMGEITFHELVVDKFFDKFQNDMVETIMRHKDIGDKQMKSSYFFSEIDNYELTKDYWKAFEHIAGRKKKAVKLL